jgi:hypothetical protein
MKGPAGFQPCLGEPQLWPANSGQLARVGSVANGYLAIDYAVLRQLWPSFSDTSTPRKECKELDFAWPAHLVKCSQAWYSVGLNQFR